MQEAAAMMFMLVVMSNTILLATGTYPSPILDLLEVVTSNSITLQLTYILLSF